MDEVDEEGNTSETIPWTKNTNKTIEEFILWKKDTAPNVEDARISALDKWIDISEAVGLQSRIYLDSCANFVICFCRFMNLFLYPLFKL